MEKDPSVNQVDETFSNVQIKYYEFSKFSNLEKVGTGAYKELFRAISESDDMIVALKLVDNKREKEVINEAKLQVKVNHHPNIIRFYGITEECWQSNRSRRPKIEEVANSLKKLMSSHYESISVNEKINDRESKQAVTEKYSKTKEQ
ncbi:3948_t:CDS:2, partial [Gigaspora rosea]